MQKLKMVKPPFVYVFMSVELRFELLEAKAQNGKNPFVYLFMSVELRFELLDDKAQNGKNPFVFVFTSVELRFELCGWGWLRRVEIELPDCVVATVSHLTSTGVGG